jgi:hypothetical protein
MKSCPKKGLRHSDRPRSNREHGWVAQLAEQRTENPRVGGSIPPPATPLTAHIVEQILQQNLAAGECISSARAA